MTEPTWALPQLLEHFEKYESTLAEDDQQALAWLRKLKDLVEEKKDQHDEAYLALAERCAVLEDQRERLRKWALLAVSKIALKDYSELETLLKETAE